MNKNQNRLIATARQYALVTFLGLGMSFAVVKSAVGTQGVAGMTEQEWLYDGGDPTLPASYRLSPPEEPIESQCDGLNEVCGIKAPDNRSGQPSISGDMKIAIDNEIPHPKSFPQKLRYL